MVFRLGNGFKCFQPWIDPQQLQDGYIKTVRPAFSRLTRKEGSEKRNKGDLQSYISLEGVCVCVYTPLSLSAGGSCALTRPVLKTVKPARLC